MEYGNYGLLLDFQAEPLQIDSRLGAYTTFCGFLKLKLQVPADLGWRKIHAAGSKVRGDTLNFT